jgi:FKBP-type peptidyl-prolyl cis-trans isomerase FkpA
MKKITLLATSALGLILVSCSDSKFDGFTRAENGLHYKFFNHDENGTTVKEGDKIYISYLITNQKNDSVIIDSRKTSADGTGYVNFSFKKSSFVGSFEDGMMMMAKGDSAAFIASADSFFLKSNGMTELPKGINPGENLKAIFKIKDIMPAAEVEAQQKKDMAAREVQMREAEANEMPDIQKFLTDNKINVKPTASGLYYVEVKKGTGAMPKATDVVKVHYTGKFLDGRVFDSSVERGEPVEFPLYQVIRGWTEGLGMMRKGGKAKFVVPSAIAYGPTGRQGIPPYSPLYFEVELIDFSAGPPPEEMQMPQPGK